MIMNQIGEDDFTLQYDQCMHNALCWLFSGAWETDKSVKRLEIGIVL